MALVGITERFADSAILLCNLLGIVPPGTWPQENVHPDRQGVDVTGHRRDPAVTPEMIERIEAMNQLDMALYSQANTLLDERLAQASRRRTATLRVLPRVRRALAAWRRPASSTAPGLRQRLLRRVARHQWIRRL